MAVSTVSGILTRIGLGRLGRLGLEPAQRYERARPGELIHIDVKKLGRIQGGAGKRAGDGLKRRNNTPVLTDAAAHRRRTVGWEYVHVCIDDATRLAYVEVLLDEKATDGRGIPAPRHCALRQLRHQRPNACSPTTAVPTVLPSHAIACRALGIRHLRDPAVSPADQRESRTVHPHHARWVGLRCDLPLKRRTQRRSRRLAGLLQSPPTTQRPQPPATHRPPQRTEQPPRVLQLGCATAMSETARIGVDGALLAQAAGGDECAFARAGRALPRRAARPLLPDARLRVRRRRRAPGDAVTRVARAEDV